jgi:4-hydroxy-3-methylbut-2-en-1-yl diphosphate reductase
VDHFVFPSAQKGRPLGKIVQRPLWDDMTSPKRVLITGGASCPDGIIQQVILRLNSQFPANSLRSLETIIAELEAAK